MLAVASAVRYQSGTEGHLLSVWLANVMVKSGAGDGRLEWFGTFFAKETTCIIFSPACLQRARNRNHPQGPYNGYAALIDPLVLQRTADCPDEYAPGYHVILNAGLRLPAGAHPQRPA